MKDYIVSMIVISIICFVSRELLSGTRIAGHLSFISGICIFLVAITPLVSLIEGIGEISFDIPESGESGRAEYESIFEDYVENAEIDLIKSEIREMVCNRFSLDPSEVRIYISYNSASQTKLERITVNLLGSAAFANSNEIVSYLADRVGCEVIVSIG